jgi:hypothetical protein
MILKFLFTIFLSFTTTFSFAQPSSQRQKVWTVAEVKTWTEKNKRFSTWQGWILYQGSDTLYHYFISRIIDNWQWFKINRADLNLVEEHVQADFVKAIGLLFCRSL